MRHGQPTKMKDVAPRLWKAHQQRKRELELRRSIMEKMGNLREGMERVNRAGISGAEAMAKLKESIEMLGNGK